jgi:hypothetical protein
MRQLTPNHLEELLATSSFPCISLYQPTHRHLPDTQQDPIRYRNLLRDMEDSLRQKLSAADTKKLMQRFKELSDDRKFWNHRTDALAILASADMFHIFELQRPVQELLVVADSFHIKPLLRILQSADRYQILCLNRQEIALYEGNRDAMDQVELDNVPATITEALGDELTEPHQTVASYGSGAGKGGKEMRHGHGGKKDELDIDMERFFRAIDRAILENHSRPSGLPLMLAALPEYHAHFRRISHNPRLLTAGLETNPFALSADSLREQAWQKIEPFYLQRLTGLIEAFHTSCARGLGSDDPTQVFEAVSAGRVQTLLLEADRTIPGRFDATSNKLVTGALADAEADDILDDFAEAVLRKKGEVVIVPRERMPTATGLAATYRF